MLLLTCNHIFFLLLQIKIQEKKFFMPFLLHPSTQVLEINNAIIFIQYTVETI